MSGVGKLIKGLPPLTAAIVYNDVVEIQRNVDNEKTNYVGVNTFSRSSLGVWNINLGSSSGAYNVRYSAIRITESVFQVTLFGLVGTSGPHTITQNMPSEYRPSTFISNRVMRGSGEGFIEMSVDTSGVVIIGFDSLQAPPTGAYAISLTYLTNMNIT